MSAFSGFPPQALQFYADVARTQSREWFDAHRDAYMTHVIEPAQAFITALGAALQPIAPGTQYDPNHTGRGSFKKIHTDQRFQKGRDPFKAYAQIFFWKGPVKQKKANAVFMVTFNPEAVTLAAGVKYFDGKLVKAYRNAAADPVHGAALADIVGGLRARGYAIQGQHYKNVPRGFDSAHPNADLLRHNAMYSTHKIDIPAAFHTAGFVDWCLGHFEAMAPLFGWSVDFLERAVPRAE